MGCFVNGRGGEGERGRGGEGERERGGEGEREGGERDGRGRERELTSKVEGLQQVEGPLVPQNQGQKDTSVYNHMRVGARAPIPLLYICLLLYLQSLLSNYYSSESYNAMEGTYFYVNYPVQSLTVACHHLL